MEVISHRFICNRWPQYRVWDHRTNRPYQFKDGALDTDDEGAQFIRSLSNLYPRFIMDGDLSGPAHGEVPKDFSPVPKVEEIHYCSDCDKAFRTAGLLRNHNRMKHGGETHGHEEGSPARG